MCLQCALKETAKRVKLFQRGQHVHASQIFLEFCHEHPWITDIPFKTLQYVIKWRTAICYSWIAVEKENLVSTLTIGRTPPMIQSPDQPISQRLKVSHKTQSCNLTNNKLHCWHLAYLHALTSIMLFYPCPVALRYQINLQKSFG
jgi:hypothetical protein